MSSSIEEVVKKHLQNSHCKRCTEKTDCPLDVDKECPNLFANYLQMSKEAAEWALSHQWIEVKERLPDKEEQVLCEMKSNGAIVSGYIFTNANGIPQVATDPSFEFEDYGFYEPVRWMKKPKN